jgi:hypothetical protein
MAVRDEVEEVFFEVGTGAADSVNLARADHVRERETELRRAHRTGERDEHPTGLVEVPNVGVSGVLQSGGVEVAEVGVDELRNWTRHSLRDLLSGGGRVRPRTDRRQYGSTPEP